MLVSEFLERSARRRPEKTALVCGPHRHTYGAINAEANRFAHCLLERDLSRQDRVAVYLENSAEAVISIFGILKAGGIFVVVNPQAKSPRLSFILNDCDVRAIVTSRRLFRAVRSGLEGCRGLRHVFLVDDPPASPGAIEGGRFHPAAFHEALARCPDGQPAKRCLDIDLASIIYTSGSSGRPKGVMLTHLNMVSAAHSIIEYLENTADDIILSCLPLSFDYGLYQVLMGFLFGGTVIMEKDFVYPFRILELMRKENASGFPIVPAMAAIFLQLREFDQFKFPRLRYITSTAQVFPPAHLKRLVEIFPETRIFSMYGLTECKRVSYLPPEELSRRPASVGKAMPNTETYLVDETGRVITTPWTPGELVVRGANVMKGYWNLPEETAKRLRPGVYPAESVLHTGDIFQMDEDGFLYFVSRLDDLIKTGGETVSPKEVEDVLYELDGVREAAVIPVEDRILGLAVKAVVVLSADSTLKEKDIIAHCSRQLEKFKIPQQVEIRRSPLPKTDSGKIAKSALDQAPQVGLPPAPDLGYKP
jgi:amino acid adenylation domain-containing protein